MTALALHNTFVLIMTLKSYNHTLNQLIQVQIAPSAKKRSLRVDQTYWTGTCVLVLIDCWLILSYDSHGYLSLSLYRSKAPIEWCIGELMPVFFYRILQYKISPAYTNTHNYDNIIITLQVQQEPQTSSLERR